MLGRGSQRVSDENIIAGNFTKLTSRSRNEEKEGKGGNRRKNGGANLRMGKYI